MHSWRTMGLRALVLLPILAGCGAREERVSGAAASLPPADPAVVAAQLPDYSVPYCIECRRPLAEHALDVVQDGKLVRLCGNDACTTRFLADPAAGIAARDSALVETQLAAYPTTQCVVMEADLDVMGTPKDFVYGARLVRLCCDNCIETFREDPARYLAALDQAKAHPVREVGLTPQEAN